MAQRLHTRRRAKVSVSIDSALLEVVDAFVDAHPAVDRSKVFDEALFLWYALLQEEARAEQLRASDDAVEPAESTVYRFLPFDAAVHLTPRL